jgi:hypothetical protein
MKALFLVICLFLTVDILFAQNGSSPQNNGLAVNTKEDSVKITLCTDANGEQGFLIKKGNGHTEFQRIDHFHSSTSLLQSNAAKSRNSTANGTIITNGTPAGKKVDIPVNAAQKTNLDSTSGLKPYKLPPALIQDPSQR